MKTELIKTAIAWGNSSGVRVPKEWEGKKTKIQLIEDSIKEDIIQYLIDNDLLKNILGIYLTGSYARGEETIESDIDILIITDTINKEITYGNYEILLISKKELDKKIKNSLYLYSQIKEAKTISNRQLIEKYKSLNITTPLKRYLKEIKMITKLNMMIVLLEKTKGKNIDESLAYSIILRLRETLMINSIKNNKIYSKKDLLTILETYDSKLSYYKAYQKIKKNQKSKKILDAKIGKNLLKITKKLILTIEKNGKKKENQKRN